MTVDAKGGPAPGEKVQRSVRLSTEVWAALQERKTLEGRSATDICDYLLKHFLSLEVKPVYGLPPDLSKKTHVIYTTPETWGAVKRAAALQERTVSALLEQLLRAYLGMALAT